MTIQWTAAGDGLWSNNLDWSGGLAPSASSDAILGGSGAYTVTVAQASGAHAVTISDAGATLSLSSTLTVGSRIDVTSGALSLINGGAIQGGVIDVTGGAFTAAGGTLDGAAVQGVVTLNALFEIDDKLTIKNGTTFAGANGVGAGTINIQTGGYAGRTTLDVVGTNTLAHVTINVGGSYAHTYGVYLLNDDPTGVGAVLTLASSVTINQVEALAEIDSSDKAGDQIVNQGTINAGFDGGLFTIDATHFVNTGTITASNNDEIVLTGAVAASLVNSIHTATGGEVAIAGTVIGGTINGPLVGGANGVLDGVIFQGALDIRGVFEASNSLTIKNGTTFAGANGVGSATLTMQTGGYAGRTTLDVVGTNTLAHLTVNLGGGAAHTSGVYLLNDDPTGVGAVLTLAPSVTINQVDALAEIDSSDKAGDQIVNQGTINAGFAGGLFTIDASHFVNAGTITASNSDQIVLTGAVAASLVSSIHTTSGGEVDIGGTVTGGTINGPLVGSLNGVLDGVAFEGAMDLRGIFGADNRLTIKGATTFAGANGAGLASVTLDPGSYDGAVTLDLIGTRTLSNVVINLGGQGVDDVGTHLLSDDPTATGVVLTLGASVTINQTNTLAAIDSSNHAGDQIINQGHINAGYDGGTFTVTADNFVNMGVVSVGNNGALLFDGNVQSAAGGKFYIEAAPNPDKGITLENLDGGGGNTFSVGGSNSGPAPPDNPVLVFQGASDADVTFDGKGGTLSLGNPFAFTGTIHGFGEGQSIDLFNDPRQDLASASISGSDIVLSFKNGSSTRLHTADNLGDDQLTVLPDANGGTLLTVTLMDIPVIQQTSGPGSLSAGAGGSFTLNLGTFQQGSGSIAASLAIALSGPLTTPMGSRLILSGPLVIGSTSSALSLSGFGPVTGVTVDHADTSPHVSLSLQTVGTFTDVVTFLPYLAPSLTLAGTPSGVSLRPIVLTITGTVSDAASVSTSLTDQMEAKLVAVRHDLATGAPAATTATDMSSYVHLEFGALIGGLYGSAAQAEYLAAIAGQGGSDAPALPTDIQLDIQTIVQAGLSGADPSTVSSAQSSLESYVSANSGSNPSLGNSIAQTTYSDVKADSNSSFDNIQADLATAILVATVAGLFLPEALGVEVLADVLGGVDTLVDLEKALNAILDPSKTPQQKEQAVDDAFKDLLKDAFKHGAGALADKSALGKTIFQFGDLFDSLFDAAKKNNKAYAHGDVHLSTFDGLVYDFQAQGEFTLAKSTQAANTFDVQARMQPSGSSSVTVITAVAAQVGADRVTFDPTRANVVWVDGAAATISATNPVIILPDGAVLQKSATEYKVIWDTGETLTIDLQHQNSNLAVSLGLGPQDGPGSVKGLLGTATSQPTDFQLADGTILAQPLSLQTLDGAFANAWRLSQGESLLDYAPGQTTNTFTNLNFPDAAITLGQLPAAIVALAARAAAAAGITDPQTLAEAELDYLETGDPAVLTSAATIASQRGTPVAASISDTSTPSPVLGVIAEHTEVSTSRSGAAQATFAVYVTSPLSADTTVHYQLVSPSGGYISASAFGGAATSGTVTILAGHTAAEFTLNLPAGALGALASEALKVQIDSPAGLAVFAPAAQTDVVSTPASVFSTSTSDFAQTGSDALLFRNASTGDWGFMQALPGGGEAWHPIGSSSSDYAPLGRGDFNGDGVLDTAFRQTSTGNWGFLTINPSGGESWHQAGSASLAYDAVATGDILGNGSAEIVFRNAASGDWGFMSTNGSGQVWHPIGATGAAYSVVGYGDFNGDGVFDVAFRNGATGDWGFMSVLPTGGEAWHPVGNASTAYAAVASADFLGTGQTEIVFRNAATGDWGFMQANNSGGETWHPIGPTGSGYAVIGNGDFNGDGVQDVAFRNTATGDWGYMTVLPTGGEVWHGVGNASLAYGTI